MMLAIPLGILGLLLITASALRARRQAVPDRELPPLARIHVFGAHGDRNRPPPTAAEVSRGETRAPTESTRRQEVGRQHRATRKQKGAGVSTVARP